MRRLAAKRSIASGSVFAFMSSGSERLLVVTSTTRRSNPLTRGSKLTFILVWAATTMPSRVEAGCASVSSSSKSSTISAPFRFFDDPPETSS